MSLTKFMNFKTLWLIALVSICFWVGSNFLSQFYFSDKNWALEKSGKKAKFYPEEELVQKFIANRDGLSQIEILFSGFKPESGDERKLEMKMKDSDCQETIRETSYPASNLSDNKPVPFRFEKITDSANRTFCIIIHSSSTIDREKSNRVFLSDNPHPDAISLTKMPEYQNSKDRSILMRPGYQNESLWTDLGELNMRLSQYKPWFLKHYFLSVIVFLSIILSLLAIISLILL